MDRSQTRIFREKGHVSAPYVFVSKFIEAFEFYLGLNKLLIKLVSCRWEYPQF